MKFTRKADDKTKNLNTPIMRKKTHTFLVFKLALLFFLISWTIYGLYSFFYAYKLQSPIVLRMPYILKNVPKIESPVASTGAKTSFISKAYAQVKPYSIDDDIREVFGQYSSQAFLLLSCENKAHNPLAKNVNSDKYESTDWGIFQINDHWQKISNPAFLTDPKINIRLAYNIFSRDGYTFKLWTCGRALGI